MALSDRIKKTFDVLPFTEIFGDRFYYFLHRTASELNGGFYFWHEGTKMENPGLTDRAATAYIRYQSADSSGSITDNGISYNLRFVASLPNCKNSELICGYISRLLYEKGFDVSSVNLNESAIWAEEMGGERTLRSNAVDFISIDFTGLDFFPTACKTEDLFIQNC